MYLLLYLLMHLEVGHGVDVGDPVLIGHVDALAPGHQLMAHYSSQKVLTNEKLGYKKIKPDQPIALHPTD